MSESESLKLPTLPYWAGVAFVIRCAERHSSRYSKQLPEPEVQRRLVRDAVTAAAQRIRHGGAPEGGIELVIEFEGQYFDHYDIYALRVSLSAALQAADNTHSEVYSADPTDDSSDAEINRALDLNLDAITLALLALEGAFAWILDHNPPENKIGLLMSRAYEIARRSGKDFAEPAERDLAILSEFASTQEWSDTTPVDLTQLGPAWATGEGQNYELDTLSFKPRARIIRTIGDKLISGPEAAVIELIKNSHDADASFSKITFLPRNNDTPAQIIIEDDGHGMTINDIKTKWMEPATTDKRDRRESPNGRKLLGSKGIGRFASARLGRFLELTSSAEDPKSSKTEVDAPRGIKTVRIPSVDWDLFENQEYLEDISFPILSIDPMEDTGTVMVISNLRDEWSEMRIGELHKELRKLISPIQTKNEAPFRILLDASAFTVSTCGFDGNKVLRDQQSIPGESNSYNENAIEVTPFPLLEASDYTINGVFDENGLFEGTMEFGRANMDPQSIEFAVPLDANAGEESCGIILVRLHVFDREPEAVRATARRAGFGHIGVREARKLLDGVCGVSIYREGFRIRPYGDIDNDWLALDSKRVQNPTMRIGRNQIAGLVTIDDELYSNLVERSSREGLEENGAFQRLESLLSRLLAERVEPARRAFRIRAGLDAKEDTSFNKLLDRADMRWARQLLSKIPLADQEEAEALIESESAKLTTLLKQFEERQAIIAAQVTMGQIVGEVMHQGNTPLSFIENEISRLLRWWPTLAIPESESNKTKLTEVPGILKGLESCSDTLRSLFNALSPLSGARRGKPSKNQISEIINNISLIFRHRIEVSNIDLKIQLSDPNISFMGYKDDLATALTNLTDNSIYWLNHHKIVNPRIEIITEQDENDVLLVFSDNGKGIPPDFGNQVFDVGFSLKPNGTGLGMSIAHEAIERSNGSLKLLPSEQGAKFEIRLSAE